VLDPKAITTYREYQAALRELDELMLSDPDTPAGRRGRERLALSEHGLVTRVPDVSRASSPPARVTAGRTGRLAGRPHAMLGCAGACTACAVRRVLHNLFTLALIAGS
jgi:hypothetical protein